MTVLEKKLNLYFDIESKETGEYFIYSINSIGDKEKVSEYMDNYMDALNYIKNLIK